MPAADLTTLSDALKRVYDPMIAEQQNKEARTWNEFEEGADEANLGGEGWFFDARMGGNQEGIGARRENENLPSAGHQRHKQGKIYWYNTYGSFEISGQAIAASSKNIMAFAQARTDEIQELTSDMIKDYNRQIFGDGTGYLAEVTADGPVASSFYVDDPHYIRLNMLIDVIDTGTPAVQIDQRTVDSIDQDATGWYVTYSGADVTASSGWKVVRHRNTEVVSSALVFNEMEGLQKIIDDGTVSTTYLEIDRTSYPIWNGHILDNGGTDRNLTIDLMLQAMDAVFRAKGKEPDWIRLGLGQRRKYFDLVAADKRYHSQDLDGGYQKLDFQGRSMTVDVDCPRGLIFFCCKKEIKKYTLREMGLLDLDGLTIRKKTGVDAWEGQVGMYANIASRRPNAHAILKDLSEPPYENWIW